MWWDLLDRSDLPDDRTALETYVGAPGWSQREPFAVRGRRARLGLVLSIVTAVLLGVAVVFGVWLATSTTERSAGTLAAVLAGIPAALLAAALLVGVIGRRHRR